MTASAMAPPYRLASRDSGPLTALLSGGGTVGEGFDFFQALRLLEEHFPGGLDLHGGLGPEAARITIRPHEGLAFPSADVRGVEPRRDGRPGVGLVVTFLGLYGVASPLPSYFGAAALRGDDEHPPALRDFLDIFNLRLYTLFYEAWKKYRPALHSNGTRRPVSHDVLLCLAGLGAPAPTGIVPVSQLTPFAGMIRAVVRNTEGLLRLVRHAFPTVPAAIVENVPRWIRLPLRPRLGRRRPSALLGRTALIGERILDVSGRFRLILGPVRWGQFEQLRPGGADAAVLDEIVRMYTPDSLDYEVELRIRTTELPVTRLGSSTNRVGRTTWVGRPKDAVISEIVAYA